MNESRPKTEETVLRIIDALAHHLKEASHWQEYMPPPKPTPPPPDFSGEFYADVDDFVRSLDRDARGLYQVFKDAEVTQQDIEPPLRAFFAVLSEEQKEAYEELFEAEINSGLRGKLVDAGIIRNYPPNKEFSRGDIKQASITRLHGIDTEEVALPLAVIVHALNGTEVMAYTLPPSSDGDPGFPFVAITQNHEKKEIDVVTNIDDAFLHFDITSAYAGLEKAMGDIQNWQESEENTWYFSIPTGTELIVGGFKALGRKVQGDLGLADNPVGYVWRYEDGSVLKPAGMSIEDYFVQIHKQSHQDTPLQQVLEIAHPDAARVILAEYIGVKGLDLPPPAPSR